MFSSSNVNNLILPISFKNILTGSSTLRLSTKDISCISWKSKSFSASSMSSRSGSISNSATAELSSSFLSRLPSISSLIFPSRIKSFSSSSSSKTNLTFCLSNSS